MGTRASNKSAHPGNIVKPSAPRRTSAEVQQEREAKAKAKADLAAEKQESIFRTAEFEYADMAKEAMADATPRPQLTTPKPPRNKKKAKQLFPIAESTEDQIGDPDFDETPVAPVAAENSFTEDESASSVTEDESASSLTEDESEIEYVAPPPKKKKIMVTEKATRTVGASTKVAERGRKVGKDEKVVAASDEAQTSKPKKDKAKVQVREEIKFAAKKMKNEVKGNRYDDMMKSMSKRPPSQLQETGGGGKKLKREGAIADINALYEKVTPASANSDQNVSHGNNNTDLMDIDNG